MQTALTATSPVPLKAALMMLLLQNSAKWCFTILQGRRLSKPQSGVNIVKSVYGTSKVILRVR